MKWSGRVVERAVRATQHRLALMTSSIATLTVTSPVHRFSVLLLSRPLDLLSLSIDIYFEQTLTAYPPDEVQHSERLLPSHFVNIGLTIIREHQTPMKHTVHYSDSQEVVL